MIAYILAALISSVAMANELPADPFQRVATKALNGDFGKLQNWQVRGYRLGLAQGVTCRGYAYLTSYGPWESPSMSGGPFAANSLPNGKPRRLNKTMCAADRGMAFGTLIWADGELRIVRDRGGWVTVARAKRVTGKRDRIKARNDRNLDFYTLKRDQHYSLSTPYAVIGQ